MNIAASLTSAAQPDSPSQQGRAEGTGGGAGGSVTAPATPPSPAAPERDWAEGAWFVRGWLAKPTNAAIVLLALAGLFRLYLCTTLELIPDETYYFLWSQHLDASYYSKGPGVGWTIAFGTWLVGDTTLGVRWLAVLLGVGTGWQLFILARRLYDEETAFAALLLVGVIPLYAIGAILMTIDALSVFFWVWSANLFLDALERGSLWRWAVVGFAVGSGFLAKYVNGVQLIGFLLFMLWSPRVRAALAAGLPGRTWWLAGFGAMLSVFAICTTPIYYWNAQHKWITVTHLKERAGGRKDPSLKPLDVAKFLQEQAQAISPVLFACIIAAAAMACVRCGGRGGSPAMARDAEESTAPVSASAPAATSGIALGWPERERFLLTLFLPLMLFYTLLSLREQGEANWTAPCYIAGVILVAAWWRTGFIPASAQAERSVIPGWGLLRPGWIGVTAILIGIAMTVALHGTAALHLPMKYDVMNRARGWAALGKAMDELRAQHNATLLLSNRYQNASVMSWYMQGRPRTYMAKNAGEIPHNLRPPRAEEADLPEKLLRYREQLPGMVAENAAAPRQPENQFSFWPTYSVRRGERALFLTDEMMHHHADGLAKEFGTIERVADIDIHFGDNVIRRYAVWLARDPYIDNWPAGPSVAAAVR